MNKLWLALGALAILSPPLLADPTTQLTLEPQIKQLEDDKKTNVEALGEYVDRTFSRHEPVYIVGGSDPAIKFQLSGKYQVLNDYYMEHDKADPPWWSKFYLAYTQTSLWDVGAPSAPFYDTTYRPEVLWSTEKLYTQQLGDTRWALLTDFQTGLTHESNGKAGDDSRSLNSFFIEPMFTLAQTDDYFIKFAPKMKVYLGSLADNRDIVDYRGYADLKFIIGSTKGLELAFIGRIGDDWDKGSIQLDVTYPLKRLYKRLDAVCIDLQIFSGFGESLRDYNESATTIRIGASLVR